MRAGTVLLVFDETHDLQTYGSILCSLGYKVLTCDSLSKAIHVLETENVSLVIVSQGSPAFEGRQVLESSQRLRPHVPVVVIARVLDMQCYLESMDLGAADYLERPDPKDMMWVVDTQMRRSEAA